MRRALLAVAFAAAALAMGAYGVDALDNVELDSVDQRFELRGETEVPGDLAVVAIDDRTFAELGERWPFRRRFFARAIDRLAADGAKVIAVDVQFTEESTPFDDNRLISSVAEAGNVVLGTSEVNPDGTSPVFGGQEVLDEIGATSGHALLPNDSGGVIRRMPNTARGLPSLAAATVARAEGSDVKDRAGEHWIDFHGPPRTIPTTSFSTVTRGDFRPGTFKGRLVLIGPSAPSLQDVQPTSSSGEDQMAGVEIQANAISTIRRGYPLHDTGTAVTLALIALLALLVPLAALRLKPVLAVVVVPLVTVAAYLGAVQIAFGAGRILPVVHPLLGLLLATVGSIGVLAIATAFERRRTRDTFARFVPDTVVDQVLARADGARLGGERRVATVMFSDIRGFTSFSESRPPDEVIDMLNRYLTTMSDVILDEGGTLVAYMGDGIMAVFGAPVDQADHADRALRAARRMTGECLDAFNELMRGHGVEQPFRIGVGLNSGPVMSGNVGSERRLEYTVIGDTTNTAARLEGMTKGTPHMLFLAESTRDLLTDPPDDLLHVDAFAVRGRTARIDVWSIASATDAPAAMEEEPSAAPA